jgi:hypothetical protein
MCVCVIGIVIMITSSTRLDVIFVVIKIVQLVTNEDNSFSNNDDYYCFYHY